MFGLGTWEIAIILVVALIVIGPKKLPEMARSVGRSTGELRRAMYGFEEEIRRAGDDDEEPARSSGERPVARTAGQRDEAGSDRTPPSEAPAASEGEEASEASGRAVASAPQGGEAVPDDAGGERDEGAEAERDALGRVPAPDPTRPASAGRPSAPGERPAADPDAADGEPGEDEGARRS